jgi:hypothetical protein
MDKIVFEKLNLLSDEEIIHMISDTEVLKFCSKVNKLLPTHFDRIKSLIESSNDLVSITPISDNNMNSIGIKFKVNKKPNCIFTLQKGRNNILLSYIIEDIQKLSKADSKRKFINSIKKEYEKPIYTIKQFNENSKNHINVLDDIVSFIGFDIKCTYSYCDIEIGDDLLFYSEDFEKYFNDILTPYLKEVSKVIEKSIKDIK